MNNQITRDILTAKEAARYLGVHLVTIYRLLKDEKIPAARVGGQWRFRKEMLDVWLDNQSKLKGAL